MTGGCGLWASGHALALAWPHAWGGASLLAAVSAGDGFSPFVIDGVRCGRCGYSDGRPFAGCPDFDKPYGVLYPHVLVGVFEEVFLNLCIGQADAELVCHSLFTLVADLVAVSTLLGEAADFCLPAEAGGE